MMTFRLPKEYWTIGYGKELIYAVECNDQTLLKTLLDKYRSTLKKVMYTSTLAHLLKVAIDLQNSEIVSILLLYGASVTLPIYSFKQTALLYAVKTLHEKIIMDIFHHTIDFKAVDSKGRTALHLAIENEDLEKIDKKQCWKVSSQTQSAIIDICRMFVNKGMKVDVKNKIGETPLFLAVKHEMITVAKYLITDCNAALDVCNEKCDSLLHLLIKNEIDVHEKYNYDVEKLHRTRCDNAKFMDLLLSKGLNVDCKNYKDETAMQLAIQKNIIHFLPTLLKYTKNVNFLSKYNETSLHMLLSRNNKENGCYSLTAKSESWSINDSNNIVEILLSKRASVDAIDSKGRTPLHLALEQKRYKIVLRMLKRFTNIRACNEHGNTVLHIAIQNFADEYSSELKIYKNEDENMRIIRTLLSKGADPTIKNKYGMAAIHIAAENNLIAILQIFKRHKTDFNILTGNGDNILHLMCKKNVKLNYSFHDEAIKLLAKHENDINATNKDGLTPIHIALMSGSVEMVKVLIHFGADVNVRHKKTLLTPLHLASIVGVDWNPKNVQLTVKSLQQPSKEFHNVSDYLIWTLVRSGADVNAKDAFGRTALHLATYRRSSIIQTLLYLEARIDAQDNEGRLPLQNVLDYDNPEGLKALLEFGVDINDIGIVSHLSDQNDGSHGMSVEDYVLEHLIKLRAVDLPVAKVYETILVTNKARWQKLYKECLMEVECLKSFVIEKGVSLYDVLHMNSFKRYHYYTRNVKLMSLSFKLEFPKYHNILKASKREALERKWLLEPAKRAFYKLVQYDLPEVCVRHILSYLKISTLTVMVSVLQQPNSNEKQSSWRNSYKKKINPLVKTQNVVQLKNTIISST